jgi:hypothetical protein
MLRTISAAALLIAFLFMSFSCGEKNQMRKEGLPVSLPAGVAGSFETVEAKVDRVYFAEENGAKFRAYQVKWKKQDIVIPDMFAMTEFKEGDTITFIVSNLEVPRGGKKIKLLQFMLMNFPGFNSEK